MELRRGFKSWCEKASLGFRRDLGLAKIAPLNPRELAKHIGITVITPTEIPGLDPETINHLLRIDPDSWSAVTLSCNGTNLIIMNSSHAPTRQNNTLAHELAHIILRHDTTQAFFDAEGTMMLKEYNVTQEAEADCLAGILLIPREALLALVTRKDDAALAEYFGVSTDLLRMRKNLSGVERQIKGWRGAKKHT